MDRNKAPLKYIDIKILNCMCTLGTNISEKLNREIVMSELCGLMGNYRLSLEFSETEYWIGLGLISVN